ncbi:MAG: hypothetical protein MI754_15725, partial [Chromatiales bacterium]|nr:hypothetical protein [Chromatiales bacterium]
MVFNCLQRPCQLSTFSDGSMLGHRIEVCSVEGKGSMFRLLVPRHSPLASDAQTAGVTATNPAESFGGLHVLVVDDEPDNLSASEALLSSWGCRVSTASGLVDIDALQDRPDLILADFHLKGAVAALSPVLTQGLQYFDERCQIGHLG